MLLRHFHAAMQPAWPGHLLGTGERPSAFPSLEGLTGWWGTHSALGSVLEPRAGCCGSPDGGLRTCSEGGLPQEGTWKYEWEFARKGRAREGAGGGNGMCRSGVGGGGGATGEREGRRVGSPFFVRQL